MIKKIAIVSLSSGILGEESVKHEVDIGLKRLNEYNLCVKLMPHAQCDIEYVKNHPKERANDLLDAFSDDSIDMIMTAIGGDDTYRLLPYLFEDDALKNALKTKVFLGFSDTTINHLMLHKLGLCTFYGQAFLPDLCEFEPKMLPYTAKYFEELIQTGKISEIRPSDCWYEERTDFSENAVNTQRIKHKNHGFELLQGSPVFSGKILGGCLESIYDIFDNSRYEDTTTLCEKYRLFPDLNDWMGKILLLETSEEQPTPQTFEKMLLTLKNTGIFKVISGVLFGKPMDELYFEEYKKILIRIIDDPALPIVANINVGHATPRCIVPFGIFATVDANKQIIRFHYDEKSD